MHRPLLSLLLCLLILPAQAGVYTYLDADGNRVYTDQPPSGNAERIELAPSNNMDRYAAPRPPAPPVMSQPLTPVYQVLRILIPEPDATIRDGAGSLIVSATSEPALQAGHSFRLILSLIHI